MDNDGAEFMPPEPDVNVTRLREDFSRVEDEQAVLGMILLANHRYIEIRDLIRAEDFGCRAHRLLWEAIGKLMRLGYRADPSSLSRAFRADRRTFPGHSPSRYLMQLADSATAVEHHPIRTYALAIIRPDPDDRVLDVLVRYR